MKRFNSVLRTTIVVLISSLFSISSNAQEKAHFVSLKGETIQVLTDFECSNVIDKRIVQDNIGIVQVGLTNRKTVAKLEGGFEMAIQKRANEIMINNTDPEQIIFIIHELRISERTTFSSERATCSIDIEFAKKKNSTLYSLGQYSFEMDRGGLEITAAHDNLITMCLKRSIDEFSNSNWKEKEGKPINLEEITKNYSLKEVPPSGCYASFNKLANGVEIPEFKGRLINISEGANSEHYKLKALERKDLKKKAVFLSDGTHLYVHGSKYSTNNYFIKSREYGKYILFVDTLTDPLATASFGLTGAIVSTRRVGIVLDTSTGEIAIIKDDVVRRLGKSHPTIVRKYFNSKKKLDDKVNFIIQMNEAHQN